MKKFLTYSLILVTLLLSGCKSEICKDLEVIETIASIVWTGEMGGCGYMIRIGEQSYKPENEEDIDESFRSSDSKPIILKYINQGKKDLQCGILPITHSVDFIRTISIKKI